MVKLWEKSSIAKIALKRGVQLTTSERMAEDIKVMELSQLLGSNSVKNPLSSLMVIAF